MLRESSVSFLDLTKDQIHEVLSQINNSYIPKFVIYDCVKVFARLTSSNVFTYAREKYDLGTKTVSKLDIARRFKTQELQDYVLRGLGAFECISKDKWPFMPGSHSWLQLEIIKGNDLLIVRRAVRLSSLGSENITTTTLSNKMMSETYSEASSLVDGWRIRFKKPPTVKRIPINDIEEPEIDKYNILNMLLKANGNPQFGFYIYTSIGKIRIMQSDQGMKDKGAYQYPAIPIGIIK